MCNIFRTEPEREGDANQEFSKDDYQIIFIAVRIAFTKVRVKKIIKKEHLDYPRTYKAGWNDCIKEQKKNEGEFLKGLAERLGIDYETILD